MDSNLTYLMLNLLIVASCSMPIALFFISLHLGDDYPNLQKISFALLPSALFIAVSSPNTLKSLLLYATFVIGLLIIAALVIKNLTAKTILIIGLGSSAIILYLYFSGYLEFIATLPPMYSQVVVLVVIIASFAMVRRNLSNSQVELSIILYIISIVNIMFIAADGMIYASVILQGIAPLIIMQYLVTSFMSLKNKDSSKLKELQDDFEYSVRKEANKRTFYMELSNEKMSKISKTDALTKSLNKKAILDTIDLSINDKRMTQFTVLMFDIDNFKGVNDNFGHVAGDVCLKTLSTIARNNIRDDDFLGRYGGDEFIIVLTHINVEEAKPIAERFIRKVNETKSPHFSISLGMSSYPTDGNTQKDLLEIADQGLYYSKEKGKNAVSYSNPEFPSHKF